MPFWRRKKLVAPSSEPADILEARKRFQEQLAGIDRTLNPADKLFKLEKLKAEIASDLEKRQANILLESSAKGMEAFLGGQTVSLLTVFGAAAATGMLPILILAAPGMAIASAASKKYEASAQKNLERQSAAYIDMLQKQATAVSALSETLLNTHLESILRSDRYEAMLIEFPSLKERFGEAAMKKIANRKPPKGPHFNDGPGQ